MCGMGCDGWLGKEEAVGYARYLRSVSVPTGRTLFQDDKKGCKYMRLIESNNKEMLFSYKSDVDNGREVLRELHGIKINGDTVIIREGNGTESYMKDDGEHFSKYSYDTFEAGSSFADILSGLDYLKFERDLEIYKENGDVCIDCYLNSMHPLHVVVRQMRPEFEDDYFWFNANKNWDSFWSELDKDWDKYTEPIHVNKSDFT